MRQPCNWLTLEQAKALRKASAKKSKSYSVKVGINGLWLKDRRGIVYYVAIDDIKQRMLDATSTSARWHDIAGESLPKGV